MSDIQQHDVNTPIEVNPTPAKSSLETALLALDNRTSQVIHLSPSQAEAVLIDREKMKREIRTLKADNVELCEMLVASGQMYIEDGLFYDA